LCTLALFALSVAACDSNSVDSAPTTTGATSTGDTSFSSDNDPTEPEGDLQTSLPGISALPGVIKPGERDVTGGDFYRTGNNSAQILGAPLGTNSTGSAPIAIDIDASIESSLDGLRIEYVRQVFSIEGPVPRPSQFIGVISNLSSEMLCDIDIRIDSFTGVNGEVLDWEQNLTIDVIGEQGVISEQQFIGDSSSATDVTYYDCVDAGSKIYFIFSGFLPFGQTESVQFARILSNNNARVPTTVEDSRVIPLGYEVDFDGNITVLFSNAGSGTRFVLYTYVIFLDTSGLPVAWTVVTVNDSLESKFGGNSLRTMLPGEEKVAVLVLNSNDFPGSVLELRAISTHRVPLD